MEHDGNMVKYAEIYVLLFAYVLMCFCIFSAVEGCLN
jgi:hypothetical protein